MSENFQLSWSFPSVCLNAARGWRLNSGVEHLRFGTCRTQITLSTGMIQCYLGVEDRLNASHCFDRCMKAKAIRKVLLRKLF
jgi:hypothetical protein